MNQNSVDPQNSNNKQELDDELQNISYTYWKRDSDKNSLNEYNPQKRNTNAIEESSKNHLGSVWNKAGTWEEKHLTKIQVEEFLNSKLSEKSLKIENSIKLDKISSYIGDVFIIFLMKRCIMFL